MGFRLYRVFRTNTPLRRFMGRNGCGDRTGRRDLGTVVRSLPAVVTLPFVILTWHCDSGA
jgi:hypothetical protein